MWAALALGLIGLIIFVQYAAGGVPFLLVAAILAWRARARIQLAVSGLGHRFGQPTAARPAPDLRPLPPITAMSAVRLVLAIVASLAALIGLYLLYAVAEAAMHYSLFNWSYSGVGLLIAAGCGWAAWSVWRFRDGLAAVGLVRQLADGAARLTMAALGVLTFIWILSWAPGAVVDDWLLFNRTAACVALPGFVFLAATALGFAHRDRLHRFAFNRPVLRAALWAAAACGMVATVAVAAAIYVHVAAHLTDRYHDLAIEAWPWGACCGMIAAATLANARSVEASFRRFGAGYGGAFICALGGLVPAMWLEAFTSGKNLVEAWNVLIFLMPIVCLVSTAVAVVVMILGWRLYRKAF